MVGRDVSYLIPKLVEFGLIPARIPTRNRTVFRFEALMKKDVFAEKYSREAAGDDGFDNARAMVNGLFNRSWSSRALRDVSMVVLGVYHNEDISTVRQGLNKAKQWGFETVPFFEVQPNRAFLEAALAEARETAPFALDGLVIAPNTFRMDYETNDKPKLIWAFKVNDEAGADVVEVTSIHWKKTRLGRWQPKIKITPTEIDGTVVTQATAHNATWMMERGIGEGAHVKVLKSGDVIPKIVGVVKKAKWTPPPGPYEFRGRFIYSTDGDDAVPKIRAMHFFCATLGIELFAEKSLSKLYEMGVRTTAQLVELGVEGPPSNFRAQLIDAFGKNQWPKMRGELVRVLGDTIPLKKLMVASGAFTRGGMGVRKLEQLEAAGMSMKTLCNLDKQGIWNEVGRIKGFSHATIQLLVDGVAEFRAWYRPLKGVFKIDGELPVRKKAAGAKLAGVNVAWTSYRSADEEAFVEAQGGTVVKYSAKMNVLLYKPGAKFADKIVKAGNKAMTWDQFKEKYGL
jgi:DNA ligase (NAD+)